jgi:uncharacterized protein (TIGR02594 family)
MAFASPASAKAFVLGVVDLKKLLIFATVAAALASPGAAKARGRTPSTTGPSASELSATVAKGSSGDRRFRDHDGAAGASPVVAEASRWLGAPNMTGRPGPWCASFASYVLRKTGRRPLANDMASSALAYGPHLSAPQVGALAVISTRRGYAGHVGFVTGVNPDGSIRLISGNWSRRVADASISRRSVVAFVEVR